MGKKPEISVILPVYNGESSIAEALDSIQKQTLKSFECLILDDGSTDSTSAIVKGFCDSDPRFKYFSLPHRGIVSVLNDGINLAQSPLLARMDADDTCHPERFELQFNHLKQNPTVGMVSSLVSFGGSDQKARGYLVYVNWINSIIDYNDILLNQFVESPIAHPSVMMRTNLVKELGGYRDGNFPEDYELWLRMLTNGVRIEKVKKELLFWSDPPNRLSRTDPRYSPDSFYRIKSKYLYEWLKKNNPAFPKVLVWGAGRVTRRRVDYLIELGIEVTCWIDINPRKIGKAINGIPVLSPEEIPTEKKKFVISYVSRRGAREEIETFLKAKGYICGLDYICAA